MLKRPVQLAAVAACAALIGLCGGLVLAPLVGTACAVTQAQARAIQAKADTLAAELQERMAEALKPLP